MEEQLKEDQQELETREKKRKVEDVKRIRRIVRENDKNKDLSHVQNEMGKLMHHDEQELFSVWEGWHWDDNRGGWLDPELCAKARREEVEYVRRHKVETLLPAPSRDTSPGLALRVSPMGVGDSRSKSPKCLINRTLSASSVS